MKPNTKPFIETVKARIEVDEGFRDALSVEAQEAICKALIEGEESGIGTRSMHEIFEAAQTRFMGKS